ncbi:MAG: hypothetical protein MK358_05835, partial [Vicinamibacterales bacterium]|nr:hypothetical protein [Vicinamibacterales bacterium]
MTETVDGGNEDHSSRTDLCHHLGVVARAGRHLFLAETESLSGSGDCCLHTRVHLYWLDAVDLLDLD